MSLYLSAPLNQTLSAQAASELRQAILDGRLKPGQRLAEQEVAEAMHLSRGPVRDALRILETESLVTRYPRRGAFVATLTLQDAEEIFSLREALEIVAFEHAIKNASDEQIDELEQMVIRMESMTQQNYSEIEATSLDMDFHEALCRISGHSRILSTWMSLRAQIRLLILTHRVPHPAEFRESAVDAHRRIVAALGRRDKSQSRELLHEHFKAPFQSTIEPIEQNKL
jgi:DNA-binding GntR family transcriptional regulator